MEDLCSLIFGNTRPDIPDIFGLFLDAAPVPDYQARKTVESFSPKFAHWDDTCCWYLDITENQFEELQKEWEAHKLPSDLFYPEDKAIRMLRSPGIFAKFLMALGFTSESWTIYTPKEWEGELKKRNDFSDR